MFATKETNKTPGLASSSKKLRGHSGVAPQMLPIPSQFLQRHLGNSFLQSNAETRGTSSQTSALNRIPTIQRKCACDGGSYASKEKETRKIQTKVAIGAAHDVYEQEADRVADQIMRMPDLSTQVDPRQFATDINIRRRESNDSSASISEADIQVSQHGGQPLSPATRAFMESRFGADFGHVRLHTDEHSHQTASQIQARAFTYGHHIWLGKGESEQNKHLMAHELTHVMQQTEMMPQPTNDSKAFHESTEREGAGALHQAMFQASSNRNQLQRKICESCSGYKSGANLNIDGVPEGSVADPFFLVIDGPPSPQMTVRPSIATPSILRQPIPPPNSVQIVQNHQFPITATHVAAGWRSGFGGVSEVEVSNGTTDYDGTNISEHFIGGLGNNAQIGGCANQSGQGGQGGSTFTVGTGVNFSQNGLNINLPPKHNTFYDLHIKGFNTNILPAGTNAQFSLCIQRYSFGGNTIFGRLGGVLPAIFFRWHGIERKTVGGQDVADIDLVKF